MQWLVEQEGSEQRREMALRLGGALLRFWEVRGHWSEGWNFLEWARTESKGIAVPVQVKVLEAAAYLLDHLVNDIDRAEALYEESLVRYQELGDTAGIAHSLRLLGQMAGRRGNFTVAYARIEEALALSTKRGDKKGIALSLTDLADVVSQQGDYARALSLNEESLALFREMGDMEGIAWALTHLGAVFLQQGNAVKARLLLEESLLLYREGRDQWGIVESLSLLGRVKALEGDSAAARTLYEESLALARETRHGQHGFGERQRPCAKRWEHPSRLSIVLIMIVRWQPPAPNSTRRHLPPRGPRVEL
jgi:tetratricopeptide (TPR) repeat protein